MSNYELCRKFIEWFNDDNKYERGFIEYANITDEEEGETFRNLMNNKYGGNWNIKECKQYIKEIENYILTKFS